ncbi:MAG: hypothetical protein WCB96_09935, partial [Candidatus Aminicenantales bacterium]
REEKDHFAGESYVVDPGGRVIARAPRDRDFLLLAEVDFKKNRNSPARRHFLRDRRPAIYRRFGF